jgi:putative flippase GtrA
VRDLASRYYEDRTWPFQLARYLTIGGFVFCVDVGTFALLLRLHWWLPLVTTAAFALGVLAHFSLNKYLNFRAHDRPLHSQAFTYGIVVLISWLSTLAIVSVAVSLGAPPLAGKVIAVVLNVPLGFLGHRYLSFGRGIAATLRSLRERSP